MLSDDDLSDDEYIKKTQADRAKLKSKKLVKNVFDKAERKSLTTLEPEHDLSDRMLYYVSSVELLR